MTADNIIRIGPHTLRNGVALAPMAGLSDVPFRTLAWQFGAGYMVSEMVSSQPQLWETGKSRLRRVPVPGAEPVAVQIAGTDPRVMAEAARRHVDDGVQIIDINFGCPAKKVCRKAAGSALLADLGLIGRIVEQVARAVDVPVTVKTRTGLVPGDGVGVEAARIAALAGANLVVMHARSRACRFQGPPDYAAVRAAVQAAGVPVLVNGGIHDLPSARVALALSGAHGMMVGQSAVGRPWLFAELTGAPQPTRAQCWSTVRAHVRAMHEFYGADAGVRIARKHVAASLKHLGEAVRVAEFQQIVEAQQQLTWLAATADQACAPTEQAA